MSGTFSTSDVQAHSKPDDLWIIVDQDVYDLTKFQDEHPGGKKSMLFAPSLSRHLAHLTQSSSALPARMRPSSSGSTTTRAS